MIFEKKMLAIAEALALAAGAARVLVEDDKRNTNWKQEGKARNADKTRGNEKGEKENM